MSLAIAVLSLTRDRLDYTKHCFNSLHEFAGCDFDHYVLDQGSEDGSRDWLAGEFAENRIQSLVQSPENIGVCRALNQLLDHAFELDDYDIVVKFDNDCELTQPDTLKTICELADEGGAILSPRILGLNNPPQATRELGIRDEVILDVPQIGGIFMAVPGWVYGEFGYNEQNPLYGRDDVDLCWWWRSQGGTCGYVQRFEAWHYETTAGQHQRYPEYFERRVSEGAPA